MFLKGEYDEIQNVFDKTLELEIYNKPASRYDTDNPEDWNIAEQEAKFNKAWDFRHFKNSLDLSKKLYLFDLKNKNHFNESTT